MLVSESGKTAWIRVWGAILLTFFGLSAFFPDSFWAVHYWLFLPVPLKIVLGLLASWLVLAFPWPFAGDSTPAFTTRLPQLLSDWKMALLFAFLWAIPFYIFPIFQDYYGDAPFFLQSREQAVQSLTEGPIHKLWSFDFTDSKLGSGTSMGLFGLFSWLLDIPIYQSIRLWDYLFGGLFIFLWLRLCQALLSRSDWWWPAAILGLFAPFLQNFFGHVEVYAGIITLGLAFMLVLVLYFRSGKVGYYVGLFPLLILCMKFHITGYMLSAGLFLASLHLLAGRFHFLKGFLHWKRVFPFILLPVYLAGGVIYFLFLQRFHSVRSYQADTLTQVTFLPLQSSEPAPLDRYNLFSPAHLWDFFQLPFGWSAAGIFLLGAVLLLFRRQIRWNDPLLVVAGTLLLIYLPLFFVLNPLLSMPHDWDLFSIPGVWLLVFLLILLGQLREIPFPRLLLGPVLGLSLFSLVTFYVNARQEPLCKRLQSKSLREFKTYWLGSSSCVLNGVHLNPDPASGQADLEQIIAELRPHAVMGNDIEFARILYTAGRWYFSETKDYERSLSYFQEAYRASMHLCENNYHLLINYFYLKRYPEAATLADWVVACKYPTEARANKVAIHTLIMAGEWQHALQVCDSYLQIDPANEFIREIRRRLAAQEDLNTLYLMFKTN
ncbi:MAG: hypothetical protein H6581_06455 [Bacteroidia bacterium]|nr:hypothetical protein [Bacteroidia bacterium]